VTRLAAAGSLLFLVSGALLADQIVEVGPMNAPLSFSPSTVNVSPGETVTWHFNSFHTATSDATTGSEVWDSGFLSSGNFSHTFTTPGSYPYYCAVHSFPGGTMMNGVVNVISPSPTRTPTRTRTPTEIPTPTPTPTRTPTRTPTPTPTVTATFGPSPTPAPLVFHTVIPCRVADTREPDGPYGGPALQAGTERIFVVGGQCGIPPAARSVVLNVTVTQPMAGGHVTLHPGGSPIPLASAINYSAGQTRANNAVVPLGPGGTLAVASGQPTGTVHFIIDVNGYFD
jgi:plastocyanin